MRRTTTSESASRIGAGFSRAIVTKTNADPRLQEGDFGMFSDESSSGAEIAYPYGWVSRVHGPREMDGATRHAESYALSATGSRSHPVFMPPSDRRFRPPVDLKEGESLNYDDEGQYVHIGRDRVTVSSPKEVVTSIREPDEKDKDGRVTKQGKVLSTITQHPGGKKVTITNADGASFEMDGANIKAKAGAGGAFDLDGPLNVKGAIKATENISAPTLTGSLSP